MSRHFDRAEVAQAVEQWTENPLTEVKMVRESLIIRDLEEILPPELREIVVTELIKRKESRKRVKAPPAPEGGISLSEGQRRFGVSNVTIHRWAKVGIIPILAKTKNCVYVDAKVLAEVSGRYHAAPGRGKRTAYQERTLSPAY